MTAQTGAGVSLAISLVAPASYDEAGYSALDPALIGEVTNVGEFGKEFATVSHMALQRRAASKRKGAFDSGSVTPTVALSRQDAGQDVVEVALERRSPVFFRITLQDSTIYWFSGVVLAFPIGVNGADDVVVATINIDVESTPIVKIDRPGPAPGYDPDAAALFARFNEEPTEARKALISDRFTAGKETTWWGKLDALWVHAAHGAEAGRLNWLGPRFNCVPVNDPVFTVDRGYAGDGLSSYLDTQFNPVVQGPLGSKYRQNSASLGIRSNTESPGTGSLAGYWDGSKGTTILPRNNNTAATGRVNSASFTQSIQGSVSSGIGMFAVSRMDAGNISMYRQGALIASSSIPSMTPANGSLRLGAISAESLRASQFSMGFVGGGMTDAEIMGIFEWFQPYREALGIA